MTFVNVYLHDRAFGGREEGGWWYDTLAPVPARDLADAWAKGQRAKRGRLDPEFDRYKTKWIVDAEGMDREVRCGEEKGFAASYRATPALIARLRRWVAKENVGRRDIGSVLSEGRYIAVVEQHPARQQPDGRPRYE